MNFKSKKRKGTHHFQGIAHKTVNRILSRNPARKEWDDIVKPLKEKNANQEHYIQRLSFKNEGEKRFSR